MRHCISRGGEQSSAAVVATLTLMALLDAGRGKLSPYLTVV